MGMYGGGGGRRGPSEAEKQRAEEDRKRIIAQAERDAKLREEQLRLAKQEAERQRLDRERMRIEMEANKPAPAATIDPGDPASDVATEAARRKGMRKSILAGESSQVPMTTGYTTLG